ncbi:hypothetical protein BDF14DRAFT_1772297 [Spinellus fusiger]|nr:hypothetical protein BDF14DRAFT_1772297 [Spinellus fusiger]
MDTTASHTVQLFLHYLTEVYRQLYSHMKASHIELPEPERVSEFFSTAALWISAHLPNGIRQIQGILASIPVQGNVVTFFIGLVLLYIVYCLVMSTLLWAYRLAYGLVRMSLLVLVLSSAIYLFQIFSTEGSEGVLAAIRGMIP